MPRLSFAGWLGDGRSSGLGVVARSWGSCNVSHARCGHGWRLSRGAGGSLRWDGGEWLHLPLGAASPQAGRPEVALDWGDWLLLRWYPAAVPAGPRAGVCVALTRSDCPACWHALRVALCQSHRAQATSPRQADRAGSDRP